MHENLARIQAELVSAIKETLKIFEISDVRPLLMAALSVAEKPLTEAEILARTGLKARTASQGLAALVDRAVLVREGDRFEIGQAPDRAFAGLVQERAEAVRSGIRRRLAACETLLESGRAAFDDRDWLMAKLLRERLGLLRGLTTLLARRSALFRLASADGPEPARIEKVPIA
jgi:DNA-binding transcriptional regulator GbsR (MarR family)